MLYLISPDGEPTKWDGQPIEGVRHPPEIEDVWSDAALNAVGLYRPLPAGAVPEGRKHVRTELEFTDGVLRYVHVTEPLLVTKEQIHAERDRRIEGGLTVATSLGTVVAIQSDSVSRENLASLKDVAETMIAMGITDKITYRDLNNVEHELEPTEVRELWLLGVTYIQAIYKVSWALKRLDPIPHDFADDSYWPSKEQA